MIGFTFRNQTAASFGVGARSVDRSLIPDLRKNEFTIPGKHGAVDYGLNTYAKRPINLQLGLMQNIDHNALRLKARDIAKWLSGKGRLIFDDEPDKAYDAAVYSYVGIEQIRLLPAGTLSVTFECQPFAESLDYRQVNTEVTASNTEVPVDVYGTAEAPCIITIKNIGVTPISGITIRRKVAI